MSARSAAPKTLLALVAAASIVWLVRGMGGIAPTDEPGAAQVGATRMVDASAVATSDAAVDPLSATAEADDAAQPTAEPVAPAPLPPDGTRLYGSVAELIEDPPPAGETVWVDAYHGEIIMTYPGLIRDQSSSRCPSATTSPLLDRPLLLQLSGFDRIKGMAPKAEDEPVLLAAGLDVNGQVNVLPSMPRHGRLVLHMGDPVFGHCDSPNRIALIERVAHVFEPKPDWPAIGRSIRESETSYWHQGPRWAPYRVAVLEGQGQAEEFRSRDGLPDVLIALTGRRVQVDDRTASDSTMRLRRYGPGHPKFEERRRQFADRREFGPMYRQRPAIEPDRDSRSGDPLEFTIDWRPAAGDHHVRALADVGDAIYEFSMWLDDDALAAQPALWSFQEVIDRFQVLDARADANTVPTATAPLPRPCPTRSVPVPLPTSTAYDSDDVMNDLRTTGFGLQELAREPSLIVSATLASVIQRTVIRFNLPTPFPAYGLPPVRPLPDWHTLWQPITVREAFKGGERVAVGETLVIRYPDPADCMYTDCEWEDGMLDAGETGATYLFFLQDAATSSTFSEEPGPVDQAYSVYRGAYGRLIVTYDRVRYSDRDRHRTEFAQDMTGCAFLEQLREEIRRVGAGN